MGRAEGRSAGVAPRPKSLGSRGGAILALSLFGLGISLYLWSAKAGASQLICGPVGDCLTVNTSAYSEILGVPVAALGAGMYALIAICVGAGALRPRLEWPALVGFAIAFAGTIFSFYLTALEAFVIHAYCAWCLVSWVIVTTITVLWGISLWKEKGDRSGRSDDPVHE